MLIYLVFLIVCFGASIVGAICGIGVAGFTNLTALSTEEDLKEMQAMDELLEKARQWEEYYWENETAEQRKQRESLECMKGFIQIF